MRRCRDGCWRRSAERLRAVRDGLEREPDAEGEIELSSIDQHQADVGSEMFEREMSMSIRGLVDARLRAVVDALRRVDSGDYGTCQACGVAIPDDRLQAMPATRFCLDHEQLSEGPGMTQSLPAGPYTDGAAFADDIAAREAIEHFEFLPTEDESDEDLHLGAEELALHRIVETDGSSMVLTPEDVEMAERDAFEIDDEQQTASDRDALERRAEADAAALEDEALDVSSRGRVPGRPPSVGRT